MSVFKDVTPYQENACPPRSGWEHRGSRPAGPGRRLCRESFSVLPPQRRTGWKQEAGKQNSNVLLCVWRHSAGSIHPVLLSPLGLWGAGFLPAVKRSGNLSETTLFSCLFFFFPTPSETCNRSNSFSWLACSASDSSVFFCCLQVNYAQNWQQLPATDNPEGQGSRALRSVLPFLSCSLLLWRSPEFLTARAQGNLTLFWFQ